MFNRIRSLIVLIVVVSASLAATATVSAADSTWKAKYWNNKTLNGTPVLTQNEDKIDYDWGTGRPAAGVSKDGFSARWTRTVTFSAGTYRFTMSSDDGARLYIDNKLVLDAWYDHAAATYTTDVTLTAGDHKIKMEYYENTGSAVARLSWDTAPAGGKWLAQYWNNQTLSGTPVLVQSENKINYDWGTSRPASGVNKDGFSARWTRTVNFSAGTYRFTMTSDDGARLYVDGALVLNYWSVHAAETHTADVALVDGDHQITMEYFENTGDAVARLSWDAAPAPTITNWKGEYWNNMSLNGTPALVRDDASVNFDWGTGSPASGINADGFSARWTRTVNFSAGAYRFTVTSDDGMRLWVDGTLLVDRWTVHAPETYTADVTLTGGNHQVKMEFFENTGGAVARLSWAGLTPPPVPSGTVVMDTTDAGIMRGGPASDWYTTNVGYNGSSLWTYSNASTASDYNWIRWYPNLKPGNYEVFVYIPAQNATTRLAPYWVHTSANYWKKVVDQSTHAGQWVSLGTYAFSGSSVEFVSLSDVTGETTATRVAFDAVKWEPR